MKQGWTYKKLGELGTIVTGSTPSTKIKEYYCSNDYCFIKPSDLPAEGYQIIVESENYISSKGYEVSRKLPKGSVLVSCIGIIGKTAILGMDACTNQQINAIIPNEYVNNKFLAYSILSQRYVLSSVANAPVVPLINKSDFSKVEIPLPPLSVQHSIVSELDKINELIRLKKEQLKDYDNLAQSIFYEMFGDPVVNEKGWEVKHVGDFGTCIAGATPSTTVEEYWINGTIPWLSSGEVSKGRIFNTDKRITQHGYNSCSTRLIPAHTIVIAMAGQGKTRGTVGVAEIPLCTNQSICSIVTNENIDVDFLYYQIKFLYNELRSASNGDGGRGGLNLRLIQKFPIISPNYSLQVSFAKRIKTVELLKSNIQSTIADLETLLASRMQYWFD